MFESADFDLIVIGSGSGGSVGASYARSLGKSVALIERDKVWGGECPNWACVPTKALLSAAEAYQSAVHAEGFGVKTGKVTFDARKLRAWRDLVVSRTGASDEREFLGQEGVTIIQGEARFNGPYSVSVDGKTYRAKRFLIATGADTFIPAVPGLKSAGFMTFKEAAEVKTLPKSIVIIGGGPIGCEFAQLYADLGVNVTLIEAASRLLGRDEPEVGKLVAELFAERGIKVVTGSKIAKVERRGGQKVVSYSVRKTKSKASAAEILVATGKVANVDFDPEAGGIKLKNGRIVINRFLRTTNPRVYVAGDIVGPLQFTHTAAFQSRLAVHNAFARRKVKPNYISVPRCVFTRPEVATVGLTEGMASSRGIKTKVGMASIGELGRANASGQFDGFVKVVTDRKGFIIGAAIVAPRAGEMIHELALAVRLKLNAYEVSQLVHAFPTYSEAIKIACANVK